MFAESGEKRAAVEAVKTISCFSQGLQSEKSLMIGLDAFAIIGVLSTFLSGTAAGVLFPSIEVEEKLLGACDETCDSSWFSAAIWHQVEWGEIRDLPRRIRDRR